MIRINRDLYDEMLTCDSVLNLDPGVDFQKYPLPGLRVHKEFKRAQAVILEILCNF